MFQYILCFAIRRNGAGYGKERLPFFSILTATVPFSRRPHLIEVLPHQGTLNTQRFVSLFPTSACR